MEEQIKNILKNLNRIEVISLIIILMEISLFVTDPTHTKFQLLIKCFAIIFMISFQFFCIYQAQKGRKMIQEG